MTKKNPDQGLIKKKKRKFKMTKIRPYQGLRRRKENSK